MLKHTLATLAIAMLSLLATPAGAKQEVVYQRYDLVCRGPLFEFHMFKNVDSGWKDLAALDRVVVSDKDGSPIHYMRMPSGKLCILMPKPYTRGD